MNLPTFRTLLLSKCYRTVKFTSANRMTCVTCQCRRFTAQAGSVPKKPEELIAPGFEDWKTVYRFNHIVLARAIQRVKIYQTGFTCVMLFPASVLSTFLQVSDVITVYFTLSASVLACVMLGIMGTMSSRVIGILYVNKKDPSQLRVARLSFVGSRVDEYLRADTFIPLTDSSNNLKDSYVVVDTIELDNYPTYSFLNDLLPANKYYLSLKYGTILDKEAFIDIFGDIWA